MKKLLSLFAVAVLGFSSVFAAYQASPAEITGINAAGQSLIAVVEKDYDSNYQILIDLLMSFQTRFADDERRTWILDTLLTQVNEKMMMNANTMDNDMINDSMMQDETTGNTVTFDITGNNFSFSQDEIVVQKGDTVTINFSSTDGFHDRVVDEFNATTDQVRPGTPTSVTFIANQSGSFEYYCSVGSHRANGMVGTLIVKDGNMMEDNMMNNLVPLEHVAIGQTIRGISFDGSETGEATTMTTNNMTHIYAEFMYLPNPGSENFYEGWVVRKSPFDFVSTGELMMKDGMYINDWMSDQDYSEYTHYILTLEPRDNDPAPAEHIFEGDM